jgi:general secretion pathway protein N
MRVEGVAPRTWLLATVTGWALVLWALALLGMGEHVRLLADDPSLLWRLPQLAPAPAERLGPLTQYSEISARPLFSQDRTPQPFSLAAEGDDNAQPAFDFVLTSVLLTPTLKMAIVQPSTGGDSIRVKLGEAPEQQPAYRLTALDPRNAVFEGPDGQHSLDLRVYDGNGGEPPTVLRESSGDNRPTATSRPGGKPSTRPAIAQPRPIATPTPSAPSAPVATPTPTPTPPPPPAVPEAEEPAMNTDAQIEGIRKRIEQRRAQLRQEAENPTAPVKNP